MDNEEIPSWAQSDDSVPDWAKSSGTATATAEPSPPKITKPASVPFQIKLNPLQEAQVQYGPTLVPEEYPPGTSPSDNPDWAFTRYWAQHPTAPLQVPLKALEVVPAAIRQVLDIPIRVHNYMAKHFMLPQVQSDEQPTIEEIEARNPRGVVFEFPRSEGTGIKAGLLNLASSTAEKFLGRPEDIVTLAALPGEGVAGKTAATVFGAQAAAAVPQAVIDAYKTIKDPKATAAQRIEAVGNPVVQAGLAALMLKHATKGETPNASEIQTRTEVHGDVQPQPVEGQGQLPSAESGGRIQPQAETGIQQQAKIPLEPEKPGVVTVETVSGIPPSKFFEMASQWSADAQNGVPDALAPQRMAERAAAQNPDLPAWQSAYDKAAADAKRIMSDVAKKPETMLERQQEISGAAQKAQFFSEGIKQLKNKAAQPSTVQPQPSPVAPEAVSSKAAPTPSSEPAKPESTVTGGITQWGRENALSRGPGAAAAGEPGTYSPIQRMADELRATAGENKPIDDQLRAMDKVKAVGEGIKDSVTRAVTNTKAIADALWKKYTGLPEYGDEQKAVGKWFYALQRADHEARQFAKAIVKEVPNKPRREAITNWIQADGDEALLNQRAQASKGTIRQGYEIASHLTPREKEIAQMLRQYYDVQLEHGLSEGILKEGLDNYITQVWKKENPITKKLVSDLSSAKLQPNFKYARKRLFDSYFEGEQAGYDPNKDAGFLVANYDQHFNRALAARAFIKDLHEGTASDGRPLVELSGNGKTTGDPGQQAILIKPKAKPEELSDYRTIDHPALRGWKWATTTPEGQNIFVQGDMLVHPEAYDKLRNRLSTSAFRRNPATRAFLNVQTQLKQTMLSVSGFHQAQETLHALGHRVNPLNLPEIDFSEPTTKALAEHGLQLADYDALASFSEGLSGSGLLGKVPGIGAKLHAYNEFLFQDYIPRLKLQMAKLALERNRERYSSLSPDKLYELTANQANAAFGELPYRYWGRSPTLQDAMRTFVLAPDFLEARARFVGQALKPFGREQLVALGLMAATQYMTARIVNQVIDKDPHWEPQNAFRIVAGKHAYGLRTIPGDLLHLFTDTRGFFYNRMSPLLRTTVESITGRDAYGVKRDLKEQVKDLAKMPVPISVRPHAGDKWWETFLNAFGMQEQRWDAVQTIGQKVSEFKKKNNITDPYETVYNREKDQYANLRTAIENGDEKTARREADKLESSIPAATIMKHFRTSLGRPLTGSRTHEKEFIESLDAAGKREYQEAEDLRKARLEMVRSVVEK